MAYTFDDVLSDESIRVLHRDDSRGYFVIQILDLHADIEIELGRFMDRETTKFRVSHAIQTPLLASPYRTSHAEGDYPAYALHRAVSGLTHHYREAVRHGHVPSDDWLVEW